MLQGIRYVHPTAHTVRAVCVTMHRKVSAMRTQNTLRWMGCLLIGCFCIGRLAAQQPETETSTMELLENFFRTNDQASESDAQLYLETLERLRRKPMDINALERQELRDLQFFSELQIENMLRYRTEHGPFLSVLELQAVPGWEISDVKRLQPFVTTADALDQRSRPLTDGISEGKQEWLLRWGRPAPPNYTSSAPVEGQPNAWGVRWRYQFDNRLRLGFTAENDPGEAFFRGSNRRGFDFYSAHVWLQNLNRRVRAVALGDFTANLGQGLLLYTSFAAGKSAEALSVVRNRRKIQPYGAFGEAFFLRGAATTLRLNERWEMTALYSRRRRDGNVELTPAGDQDAPDVIFTALQTAGLHRTAAEVADERAVREEVAALSLMRQGRRGQVTLNGLWMHYDKPWQPDLAPYRRFVFTGTTLLGASVDYAWRGRNWLLTGETARSGNGGLSTVNALQFSPARKITFSVLQRALGRNYQYVYAAPFAESNGAANERGVYMGLQIRPAKPWQIDAYADWWRHPWLRFGVRAPSAGKEYLLRVMWTPNKTFSTYVLGQVENKQRDSEQVAGVLSDNRRARFRIHVNYKVSRGVELRSRAEWTHFRDDGPASTRGFLAFQEAVWRPLQGAWSGSVRYALFDTESFDTRIFTFENDLFAAISIPGFAGRGERWFLNVKWRANNWLRLEARAEQTRQIRAVTTDGSTGYRRYWKVQATLRF